jgi:hypothetical protein
MKTKYTANYLHNQVTYRKDYVTDNIVSAALNLAADLRSQDINVQGEVIVTWVEGSAIVSVQGEITKVGRLK